MENDPPQDDAKASRRGRFTARLFGRDRKISNADSLGKNEGDLNDFLHGSSDKLHVQQPVPPIPPPPPVSSAPTTLAKLDTSSASRYPDAHDFGGPTPQPAAQSQQTLTLRQRPQPPNVRRGKGLTVRFADTLPEVIGEGGDETEAPPAEIGRRRRAGSAPAPPPHRLVDMGGQMRAYSERPPVGPPPTSSGLRRTKTGYSIRSHAVGRELPAATPTSPAFLGSPAASHDEKRRSFIEAHQAEMREAEGMAFQKAVRSASTTQVPPDPGQAQAELASPGMTLSEATLAQVRQPQEPDPPSSPVKKTQPAQSPSSVYSDASSPAQNWGTARNALLTMDRGTASPPSSSPHKSATSLHDVVSAANDDAMTAFVARTRHLFELFRLQSETVRPLLSCAPDDTARAGLWWFLQGRMALEITIRERPSSPQAERRAEMARQQAYADLAKSYWLMEEIYPKLMMTASTQRAPTLPGSVNEPDEVRKTLSSNLRKLAMSMKRNGFLPPEDAFLPATIDKTIWVKYPPLSQDIVALLRGYWGSALANLQNQGPSLGLMESMPLGDTTEYFSYGRIVASVYLMEQGMESQHYLFPCLLSMVRPQKQTDVAFVITSQHAAIQLKIQNNKPGGPSWDDVQWRPDSCTIKMKLPRGFVLVIQASQADYKLLWTMYDFSYKIHATLYPRKDEQPVFGTTLPSFQYFDSDPQSRAFPQDVVSHCEVALFERLLREGAAAGPRTYHRGFRIAIVTGPKTRMLSGTNHVYTSRDLLQIGFLRGDQNLPALLLKFDDGRTKGSMVLTLADEKERISLHGLLTGMYQHHDEISVCEVGLAGFLLTQRLDDREGFRCWKKVQPQRIKVINDESAGEHPPTVLADRLRVVMECEDGSIMTDRINVAPGEFRIRLDVKEPTVLGILRLPQTDMTVSIPDQQPRDLRAEMAEALKAVQTSPTIRSYKFASHADLHAFQAAVTGFAVLFDGVASTFAISRRRMVVPIHKKWEAGATRVQVVQQEGVTQLLAFFDDFHHGHCMGLVLKGTDVFETSGRAGKAGLKIVDAKFPLPRVADEAAAAAVPPDVAFVCLDYPDLPGEHDDISIIFESEADRDRLTACLPAPVKGSRLMKR